MTGPQKIEHYEYASLNKGDSVRIVWSKADTIYDLRTEWGGYDYGYQRYVSKAGEFLPLSGGEGDPDVYLRERYQKPWPVTGSAIVFRYGDWRRIGLIEGQSVRYFDLNGNSQLLVRDELDDWRRIIARTDLTEVSLDD